MNFPLVVLLQWVRVCAVCPTCSCLKDIFLNICLVHSAINFFSISIFMGQICISYQFFFFFCIFWVFLGLYSEKAMAPQSSTLAWKIPWKEEPGGLQSMGLLRVGHDSVTSRSLFTFMHWRRKWQPTPVFLPGESQGQRSLVGCCLWGRTESDTTEVT